MIKDDPFVLSYLRKLAGAESIHYSTAMSGNRLTLEEVKQLLDKNELSRFDAKQRRAKRIFKQKKLITARDVAELFKIQPRTARALCQKWVESEFFIVMDQSKKKRCYRITPSLLEYRIVNRFVGNR